MLWVSCVPTASLFVLLLLCLPAQNGGENKQPTDVISVWEGDSINITCSINRSGTHVGMYLELNGRYNVVYLSKDYPPNISPDYVGRVNCLREGEDYRITLHNVQESDSNVYLCTEYVLDEHRHKKLDGKRTIVLVKAGEALKQSPLHASPQQGQSVSITCAMDRPREGEDIYLLRTLLRPERVLHVSNQSVKRILPAFAHRLNYSEQGKQIVITLHNLQKSDTDHYVCAKQVETAKNTRLLSARGTVVLVKDAEGEQAYSQQTCSGNSWAIYSLVMVVALLFCALVCLTLYRVNIQKHFQNNPPPNVVYEDMSYSSRRNTLVRTNTYSKAS